MRSGILRERVTIVTNSVSKEKNELGDMVSTGANTTKKVWAQVIAMKGAEAQSLGLTLEKQPYKIMIRYSDAVSSKDRIVWRENTMSIISTIPSERKDYLILYCIDYKK